MDCSPSPTTITTPKPNLTIAASSVAIMQVPSAQFKIGDFVEYRPIGGASDNVAHSKGEIKDVIESEDGSIRYAIRNGNTGKTTKYQESNIVGKTERD